MATKRKTMAKSDEVASTIGFDCRPVRQGPVTLYTFAARAATLWAILKINEKIEDKDEGYQRVLSPSRVRSIATYIKSGRPIPLSILVTFDKARVENNGTRLSVPKAPDAGWVIDGQHRLAGAHQADSNIELPVVAFVGLALEQQIEQFVTVNREAKGVPASLYFDLLKHLPPKSKPAELAKERAADIGNDLKRDEESPFFGKIVVTTAPKQGEISLVNFVRKVAPLVVESKGALSAFTVNEQRQIISNYYRALQVIFPKEFNKVGSVFFKTLGFGALMNALPTLFNLCLKHHQKFRVGDVAKVLREIGHFDFSAWDKYGTGNAAEIQAGEDLRVELIAALETAQPGQGIIDL